MYVKLPWAEMAETLGYKNKEEMLLTMYKTMGIKDIADILGVYPESIRDWLIRKGVTLRSRGGPNNIKHFEYVGDYAKRIAREKQHTLPG
jgi:phage antirepressor YoqD-like protein